ncbi:MAG: hypothetical protein ACYS76_12585 [Planctomycetota bacterium]|jgi:hypothetical protein
MKTLSTAIVIFATAAVLFGCAPNAKEQQLQGFVTSHVDKIKPMFKEAHLAYWQAANSGDPEDYDRVSKLEYEIRQIYTSAEDFALCLAQRH